jgi:hypothetical protein
MQTCARPRQVGDDAEVVEASQVFAHGHGFGAPSLVDQAVVAQEFGAFVTPGHGEEHALARALPFGRAAHAHLRGREAQVALHKRRFANGLQVKQARDGQRLAHQASGQIAPDFFQSQPSSMAAR